MRTWLLALLALLPSCKQTEADRGRELLSSTKTSNAPANPFSCATCHPVSGGERRYPGGSLDGATSRRTFWGGERLDLLESINDCRTFFMDARAPWTKDDPQARAVYAYLATRSGPPVAFTPVRGASEVPRGDAKRGERLYALACRSCHGAVHDGDGRIASFVPILPDEPRSTHAASELRGAFVTKVRLGAFASKNGSMPPFSSEALSDPELGDVLSYLGLE